MSTLHLTSISNGIDTKCLLDLSQFWNKQVNLKPVFPWQSLTLNWVPDSLSRVFHYTNNTRVSRLQIVWSALDRAGIPRIVSSCRGQWQPFFFFIFCAYHKKIQILKFNKFIFQSTFKLIFLYQSRKKVILLALMRRRKVYILIP